MSIHIYLFYICTNNSLDGSYVTSIFSLDLKIKGEWSTSIFSYSRVTWKLPVTIQLEMQENKQTRSLKCRAEQTRNRGNPQDVDRTENLNKDDVTGYAFDICQTWQGKDRNDNTGWGGTTISTKSWDFKRACPQWHRDDSEVELCSGGRGVRWVNGNNIAIEIS